MLRCFRSAGLARTRRGWLVHETPVRWRWSLAALLDQPRSLDDFLSAVRTSAAASAEWDIDCATFAERSAATTLMRAEDGSVLHPTQLLGRVCAALAGVLLSPSNASTSSTAAVVGSPPPPRVTSLSLTLSSPEAVLTLTQLITTTPLLASVESVELTLDSAAASTVMDSMEGTGGQEVVQLLRVLAAQSAHQPTWTRLVLWSRDTASTTTYNTNSNHNGHGSYSSAAAAPFFSAAPTSPSAIFSSAFANTSGDAFLGRHSNANTSASMLMSPYAAATSRRVWDDATASALAALLASKSWRHVALRHVDLTACTASTRQRVWASLEASTDTLDVLDVTGSRPAREMVGSGLLRRTARLSRLELGSTQLEEDALAKVLFDLQRGVGGWWRLQHLGLAQCDVCEEVVTLMAEQLRKRDDTSAHGRGELVKDGERNKSEEKEEAEEDVMLTSLDVAGARLSRTAAFTFAGCLVPCIHLQHLNTRHCRLQADGVAHIAAALQHATELESWNLCLNRFSDEGAAAVAKYGKFWPTLNSLDLSRCRLTTSGVAALSAAMVSWDGLEVLRLVGSDLRCVATPNGNTITLTSSATADASESARQLFAYDPQYMKGHGNSAKVPTSFELDRRDRAEGRRRYRGPDALIRAARAEEEEARQARVRQRSPLELLAESVSLCRRLRIFDLSDCSLTDHGLCQLSQHLRVAGGDGLSSLEELRLSANPLFNSVAGLDALVVLLRHTPALHTVDVSFTALGDLGVSMLCDGTSASADAAAENVGEDEEWKHGGVLARMTALTTLQLSSCGVHSLGWESLTAALPQWPELRHLSLDHNLVSDGALLVEFLGQLTTTVPVLQSVNLVGCLADVDAVEQLVRGPEYRALRARGVTVFL